MIYFFLSGVIGVWKIFFSKLSFFLPEKSQHYLQKLPDIFAKLLDM